MAAEFTIAEAQERLEELIDRVESGEEVVITRFGAPSVSLQ
ncbi:type II toxin-antitoxin system prevent-host-death family antitoxin, partial [Saccharopolyspora taberi]